MENMCLNLTNLGNYLKIQTFQVYQNKKRHLYTEIAGIQDKVKLHPNPFTLFFVIRIILLNS